MNYLDIKRRMTDTAREYAAEIRARGFTGVTVLRYRTALDNRNETRRDHQEASGYAVRYSSDDETDLRLWRGSQGERQGRPMPKFHDRSLTVFTGPGAHEWLTQGHLTTGHSGILASLPEELLTPYYTAAWSAADKDCALGVPYVILKRSPVRQAGDSAWVQGPARMFYLLLTPVDAP
jgi:hypothetical protein